MNKKKIIKKILNIILQNNDIYLANRFPEYQIHPTSYGDITVKHWHEGANLKIGAYSSFGEGVTIFLGGEHRTDWVSTYPFNILWKSAKHITGHPKTKGDVIIGNDVWIGYKATILSGTVIGDGAVIGANSVVSRSIPPYAIAAGNPARVIKYRFNEVTIKKLLQIQWWNWNKSKIDKALIDMLNDNIENFIINAENKYYDNI